MRIFGCTYVALLCCMLGCADRATIGGLCPYDMCSDAGARDAGCIGAACSRDAGADACGARGCAADAAATCSSDGSIPRTRLDLMMVVDDSASLAPWLPALHEGLDQFLVAPESRGIGVGLQRFDEVCEAQAYVTPIVPIGPLPTNLASLQQAAQLMLTASTSTIPALDGALQYARSWALAHSDAQVAVVLLTDAAPGACDGLAGDFENDAANIARAALEGTPSIKTYVIGFSVLQTMIKIAHAGGTEPRLISVTPADGEVKAALDSVVQEVQLTLTKPCMTP